MSNFNLLKFFVLKLTNNLKKREQKYDWLVVIFSGQFDAHDSSAICVRKWRCNLNIKTVLAPQLQVSMWCTHTCESIAIAHIHTHTWKSTHSHKISHPGSMVQTMTLLMKHSLSEWTKVFIALVVPIWNYVWLCVNELLVYRAISLIHTRISDRYGFIILWLYLCTVVYLISLMEQVHKPNTRWNCYDCRCDQFVEFKMCVSKRLCLYRCFVSVYGLLSTSY